MHPTIAKAQLTSQPQFSLRAPSVLSQRGEAKVSRSTQKKALFADPLGPPSDSDFWGPTGLWIKDSVLQSIYPD